MESPKHHTGLYLLLLSSDPCKGCALIGFLFCDFPDDLDFSFSHGFRSLIEGPRFLPMQPHLTFLIIYIAAAGPGGNAAGDGPGRGFRNEEH